MMARAPARIAVVIAALAPGVAWAQVAMLGKDVDVRDIVSTGRMSGDAIHPLIDSPEILNARKTWVDLDDTPTHPALHDTNDRTTC